MNITNVQQQGEVTTVRVTYTGVNDSIKLLLRSDAHHDSVNCKRDLEKKHLDEATRDGAYILDAGDLFDGMQGRNDPRRGYQDLRPEFMVANYFDVIENDAYEFYKPYAENWLIMGKGNHELSVLKNTQIDLTSRLSGRLHVNCGGVSGWVKFRFEKPTKGSRTTVNLRYHHGGSGNAPVTKGVIDTARQAAYLPDADIVWNGHNHNAYIMPQSRERITDTGRVYRDIAYYLRTPGYKDQGDWEREKMFPPTPHGAIWVTIKINSSIKPEIECRTAFE
ncbi:MAG: hypothetical protein WC107_05565 [Patescibacteria group bacterium]